MICYKCGFTGTVDMFSKSNVSKDGMRSLCKKCKSDFDRDYRLRNKDKIAKRKAEAWRNNPKVRKKNKLYKEKRRTGMNATEYVKDKCCELYGITNSDHLTKYHERLHIHHKNNNGRRNIRMGEEPEHCDLQILCRSCHVREDNKNRDYKNRDYSAIGRKSWKTRRKNQSK